MILIFCNVIILFGSILAEEILILAKSDSLPIKIARFWDDYNDKALTMTGALAFALAGILPGIKGSGWAWLWSETYGRIFIFATFFTICGAIANLRYDKKVKNCYQLYEKVQTLEDQLAEAKGGYFYLLEHQIQILFTQIDLGNNDRISVYSHEEQAFIMLGRYSPNPEYKKPGRGIYPDDQGCIGEAWRQGKSIISNIPNPGTKGYYREMLRWNITENIANSLQMKSQCYVGYAIHNNHRNRIAVIVFESIDPSGLDDKKINSKLIGGGEEMIALFLEKMHSLEPTPTFALDRGF